MIDIHSHVLNGIDDGAKSIEISIEMLKKAEKSGTKAIVMTPHFCRGYGEAKAFEVKNLTEKLKKEIRNKGINIEIYHGQEIFLTDKTLSDFENKFITGINDTNYMLLELPMDKIPHYTMEVLYELKINGINPILAHPERYEYVIKEETVLNKFINEGCLFQLNSGSIEGVFGKKIKNVAENLLKNNIYSFIGSDAHSMGTRNTNMKEAKVIIESIKKGTMKLFEENALEMINGKEINIKIKNIEKKKKLFNIFKF